MDTIGSGGDCGKTPLNLCPLASGPQLQQTDATGKWGSNDLELSNFQEVCKTVNRLIKKYCQLLPSFKKCCVGQTKHIGGPDSASEQPPWDCCA